MKIRKLSDMIEVDKVIAFLVFMAIIFLFLYLIFLLHYSFFSPIDAALDSARDHIPSGKSPDYIQGWKDCIKYIEGHLNTNTTSMVFDGGY